MLERQHEALISVHDVAITLGISIKTVRRLIDASEIVVVRIGRSVRIEPRELREFIAKQRSV